MVHNYIQKQALYICFYLHLLYNLLKIVLPLTIPISYTTDEAKPMASDLD